MLSGISRSLLNKKNKQIKEKSCDDNLIRGSENTEPEVSTHACWVPDGGFELQPHPLRHHHIVLREEPTLTHGKPQTRKEEAGSPQQSGQQTRQAVQTLPSGPALTQPQPATLARCTGNGRAGRTGDLAAWVTWPWWAAGEG